MKRKPNIAVVGATGVVGSTFLKVLEERDFPFENIYLMASAKSAGKTLIVATHSGELLVEAADVTITIG